METLFARFLADDSGVTAIEYSLIAGLVGLAIIIGAGALGSKLNATFTTLTGSF
jgi:pilus assembly protein Flp/PilA